MEAKFQTMSIRSHENIVVIDPSPYEELPLAATDFIDNMGLDIDSANDIVIRPNQERCDPSRVEVWKIKIGWDVGLKGFGADITSRVSGRSIPRILKPNLESVIVVGIGGYTNVNSLDIDIRPQLPFGSFLRALPQLDGSPNEPCSREDQQEGEAADNEPFIVVHELSSRRREAGDTTNEWLAYGFMAVLGIPIVGLIARRSVTIGWCGLSFVLLLIGAISSLVG
ncbi:hypothetical protein [Bradyrhizobium australafricanum]|uniref:hypothetical protein n=1 Tax=Bradyrhizobium australafricanum TaxID=2821406 RepID=UPI001CE306B9|nr:hypothetical protein [Bradyrhizobium australafricanum]MCA6099306.1 hypothetical protein [Bradyrhizobium australafricanum]